LHLARRWTWAIKELASLSNDHLAVYIGPIASFIDIVNDEDDAFVWTTSPVALMMSNFQNPAIEQAVRMHDRLLVDGLTFINKFNADEYLARAAAGNNHTSIPKTGVKKFIVVVLTSSPAIDHCHMLSR